MTYLDLINNVLRRLREDTVTTANATDYSSLIGDLVNDAKRVVEDAFDWTALRESITVNTVSGTDTYSLTGSGDLAVIKDVMNTTSQRFMHLRSKEYFNNVTYNTTPQSGEPDYFTFVGTDSNRDLEVQVYPKPDAVYALRFDVVKPQSDLSSDSDSLSVPTNPVVQLAYAMALRERGETGGQSAAEQFAVAATSLSDAVAFDANRYPSELTFQVT
jgi:hypothetical protein